MTHLYAFPSLDERERVRRELGTVPEWRDFLSRSRPHLLSQSSSLFVESLDVVQELQLPGVNGHDSRGSDGPGVYQLKTQDMDPEWGSPDKLLDALYPSLKAKVKAARHVDAELVTVGASVFGRGGRVVQLWRYPSLQAIVDARGAIQANRQWASSQRAASQFIRGFGNAVLRPTPFSPWQ